MVGEEPIHKISLCLRISIWIFSIIYTIFLLLVLLKWFIGFPYIESLEVDLKYLSSWTVSSYFVIVLLSFAIASLSLSLCLWCYQRVILRTLIILHFIDIEIYYTFRLIV